MSEQSNSEYNNVISTPRLPEQLAAYHGYGGLDELVEGLPRNARVLDVGAGTSQFGSAVAVRREDIEWHNFDFSYDSVVLDHARQDAPENVTFTQGDATKLDQYYMPNSFDLVLSYWLTPHLSLDRLGPALEAARGMLTVTKEGRTVSVGPRFDMSLLHPKRGNTIRHNKIQGQEHPEIEIVVRTIALQTKAPPIMRAGLRRINNASMLFGRPDYIAHDASGRIQLFHPETGTFVPLMSPKGVAMAGRLAIKLAGPQPNRST